VGSAQKKMSDSDTESAEDDEPDRCVDNRNLNLTTNYDPSRHYAQGTWRFKAQRVLLTYSALHPGELTKEVALAALLAKVPAGEIIEYVVCEEYHANPANPNRKHHIHAYLRRTRSWDTRNQQYFWTRGTAGTAPGGARRMLKPYIQIMGPTALDRERVIRYLYKDGRVISHLAQKLPPGQETTSSSWVRDMKASTSARAGMKRLFDAHGDVFFKRGKHVNDMLKVMHSNPPFVHQYRMGDFARPALDFAANRVWVLSGAAGIGKSKYALAHFTFPLVVTELEDLSRLEPAEHDGIVFDDVLCTDLTPEQTIHLLESDIEASVRGRYRNSTIPAGMPKIFTTNRSCTWPHDHIFTPGATLAQHGGIQRRFQVVTLLENIY
jgi:hypothetical protein